MDATKLVQRRTVALCLLASVLMHLVGLASSGEWAEEVRVEVIHLQPVAERFGVERLHSPGHGDLPWVAIEQLRMEAYEALAPEAEVVPELVQVPQVTPDLRLQEEFVKRVYRRREEGLALAQAVLKALTDVAFRDTLAGEMLDLLRIRDLAHADRERAMVIADPTAPKNTVGYVNFSFLRVRGAGSFSSFNGGQNRLGLAGGALANSSSGAVADLARFMRDHIGVVARVRRAPTHQHFFSRQLLKDLIHFFFQGGGMPIYDTGPKVRFFPEERALLGEYLRGGGFLFVEGSNLYLRDMIAEFEAILGADGHLVQLPGDHPIYSSYYTYTAGFPREYKRRLLDLPGPDWYYPGRYPGAPYPEGLWGVEVGGDLVAVLCDLQLLSTWEVDASLRPGEEGPIKSPYLQAGINIVLYALTREGGLTAKRERPLWAAATGVTRLVSGAQPF